jgi:uncharacterized small protein (DUF1192 family)
MVRSQVWLGALALAAFLTFTSLAPEAYAADAPKPRDYKQLMQQRVDYNGIDDPKAKLSEILDELAGQYDLTFDVNERAFEPEGLKDVLTISVVTDGKPLQKMNGVRFDRLLRKILDRVPCESGATFVLHEDVIEITTMQAVLGGVYANGQRRGLPLVNADFEKKPLDEALKELAKQSEFNILIDPRPAEKVKTPVTAKLKNVPLDSAVQLLADMADLKAVLQDNILYVTTKENAKGVEIDIRKRIDPDLDDMAIRAQLEAALDADKKTPAKPAGKAKEAKPTAEAIKARIQALQAEIDRLKAELDKTVEK